MNLLHIYTDGSCSPNPGDGGWGIIIIGKKTCPLTSTPIKYYFENWGGKKNTTNNEMEMTAFYEALQWVGDEKTIIYTDSKYVMGEVGENIKNGVISGWLVKQIKNGYKTSNDKPIQNVELWKKIVKYIEEHKLTFEVKWVRGHDGNLFNERADDLANLGRKELNI